MSTAVPAATEAQTHSHLTASRDAVLAYCAKLTPEAWHKSDGPGRWTPAQILEHLVIMEGRLGGLLPAMLAQPAESDWRERTAAQEPKIAATAVATTKVEAPPPTHPQGKQSVAELQAAFAAGREPLLALVPRRAELEQRVRMHPAFGELNAWQWLRLVGYHSERHLAQMKAIGE